MKSDSGKKRTQNPVMQTPVVNRLLVFHALNLLDIFRVEGVTLNNKLFTGTGSPGT